MADITAAMVKDLREKSGAGMMDCKKALTETERATWKPRSIGCAPRASPPPPRSPGRTAAEGLVGVAVQGHEGRRGRGEFAETDFVAKNEQFQDFVRDRDADRTRVEFGRRARSRGSRPQPIRAARARSRTS